MKGIILIPVVNKGYASIGRYVNLFNIIKKDLNFDIEFTNDCNIKKLNTYDVVVIFKSPENHTSGLMKDIIYLSTKVKLIGYWTDIHSITKIKNEGEDTEYFNNLEAIFNRCNKILCAYKSPFLKKWPELKHKFEWFPHFVEYILDYNNIKINKCLLTGAIDSTFYPLRSKIKKDNYLRKQNNYLDVLIHPGYNKDDSTILERGLKIGKNYYEFINKYLCSVATSGIEDYTTGKYFEIPASGTLLLANETNDLFDLGFKDKINYININKNTYKDIIEYIILNPNDYYNIIKSGQNLVKDNYTLQHSANKLERIVNEVCSI